MLSYVVIYVRVFKKKTKKKQNGLERKGFSTRAAGKAGEIGERGYCER